MLMLGATVKCKNKYGIGDLHDTSAEHPPLKPLSPPQRAVCGADESAA